MAYMAQKGDKKYAWMYHIDAEDDQDPPVINTWYPILEDEDVRISYIWIRQVNDETNAKNLEVRLTLDGVVAVVAWAANDATDYYIMKGPDNAWDANAGIMQIMTSNADQSEPLFALSAKIEQRITAALGTNQEIRGNVRYTTLEET